MLLRRLYPPRIPRLRRPLRPPRANSSPSTTRYFTNNTQLLLVTKTPIRPQLPFLYTSTANSLASRLVPGSGGNGLPISRLLSTERRKKITEGLKVAVTCYIVVMAFYVIQEGIYQQKIENLFPTPPDWSFMRRWNLRNARALQHPESIGLVATDWVRVASYYKALLEWLEDEEGVIKEVGDNLGNSSESAAGGGGPLIVEGVGNVGIDVRAKSESWKKGYFEALMGAAEAAEKLDGWVHDPVKDVTAPPEYIIGPSNPSPRPPPPGRTMDDLPREENCVPAFPSPEVYYIKILTTEGFQRNQRLDAALAYADWLDFKGLNDTAGHVHRWALEIAASGLGGLDDATRVVDLDTGVLKEATLPDQVTENLLRASTALGVHQVRTGDLTNALSTFLSLLRVRRSLPQVSAPSSKEPPRQVAQPDQTAATVKLVRSFIFGNPYPTPVLTGDEPAVRSPASFCEEAALMLYVGEILFASSSRDQGLSWTREAVDVAEEAILQLRERYGEQETPTFSMRFSTPQERCQDCLKTGMDNWKAMLRKLVVQAENEELEAIERTKSPSSSSSSWWRFWASSPDKLLAEKMMRRRRWEAEEMIVQDRANSMSRLIGDQVVPEVASGMSIILS